MIAWLLSSKVALYAALAVAGTLGVVAVLARYYYKGKDAARAEAIERSLKNVAIGIAARAHERANPTDPKHDPWNRDNWGR